MAIDEKTEALIDKAVLSALDIDPYKKTVSYTHLTLPTTPYV